MPAEATILQLPADATLAPSPTVEPRTVQPALINSRELMAMIAVSKATFGRLRAGNRIGPQPIRLAGLKWDRDEVLSWLRHRRPDGSLLDAVAWGPVWAALQKKK